MYELFFFIALLIGIVGAFAIYNYSRGKQRGLICNWRKQRGK
ncbi:hypothetical protein [Bacillus sp. FJAT-45350]|nr:hypothetical protein [Bacillus sp. FJAT-45350]